MQGGAIGSQTGMVRRNQLYEEWREENVGSEMAWAKILGPEEASKVQETKKPV